MNLIVAVALIIGTYKLPESVFSVDDSSELDTKKYP